jgi:hypothetical protein
LIETVVNYEVVEGENMVGDLNRRGFLGDEIQESKASVVKSYQKLFDLFYELNEYSQKKKFEIQPHEQNGQEVLSACLFIRILNGAQATCILSSHGLANDARVVLRSILEGLFMLTKMLKDPSFVRVYVGADEIKRLKIIRAARNSSHPVFAETKNSATDEVIESLQKRIEKENFPKRLNVKDIAESVGMGLYYESAYSLLSDDIHTAVRSLERYVGTDSEGGLDRIEWGPQFGDVPLNLAMAIDVLLRSWAAIDNLFKLGMESELKTYMKRLETVQAVYDK